MSRNNLKLNLFKSTRRPGRCTFGNPHIQQQQKCRTLVSSAKFRNFTYLVSFRVIDWQLKCADKRTTASSGVVYKSSPGV